MVVGMVVMTVVVVVMMVVIMSMVVDPDATHMVVVADLGRADVALVTDDLLPIFTELAVHFIAALQGFLQS